MKYFIAAAVIALGICGAPCAVAQPNAPATKPGCANVYIIDPGEFIASPTTYWEVSSSIDGAPFVTRGKLRQTDWGAFQVCGSELVLRFRILFNARSVAGPDIRTIEKDSLISIGDRTTIYFGVGEWRRKEVSAKAAEQAMERIDARRIDGEHGTVWSTAAAGWDWTDRRDLFYGPGTKCAREKSERCP